jgi:hypothetical protein
VISTPTRHPYGRRVEIDNSILTLESGQYKLKKRAKNCIIRGISHAVGSREDCALLELIRCLTANGKPKRSKKCNLVVDLLHDINEGSYIEGKVGFH